jgi:hypothetical protein
MDLSVPDLSGTAFAAACAPGRWLIEVQYGSYFSEDDAVLLPGHRACS